MAERDGVRFTAKLYPSEGRIWPPLELKLSSKPEMPLKNTLAEIYYARPYEQLDLDARARVDTLSDALPR